jgi:hypothetical protein
MPARLSQVLRGVEEDFKQRLPGYHKSRRGGLATLTGVMLETRSANLMELAAALPREIGSKEHRYQYIERLLGNAHIDCGEVMQSYAGEIFRRLGAAGQTIVLMLDQSKINELNQVLMLSVRIRGRALPVAWRVRTTKGNIGFAAQKDLLTTVTGWFPEGVRIMLAADRFYGTAALIQWCQEAGWDYRIRLRSNLTLAHQGGELSTGDILGLMPQGIENAELYGTGVTTGIGVLHEAGHREPWIIAMRARPGKHTVLDYGLRWGIEAMFSDFKSRGFGLMQSQIERPERLERLILIMAIAMYWAVSAGVFGEAQDAIREQKNAAKAAEIPVFPVQTGATISPPLPDRIG